MEKDSWNRSNFIGASKLLDLDRFWGRITSELCGIQR